MSDADATLDELPDEPLHEARTIFERSVPGRSAWSLPALDVPEPDLDELLPAGLRRSEPPRLPEVAELDLVRHYVRLSQLNASIDTHFYPLGSCTMKYNPKVHEKVAALPGFAALHPLQEDAGAQGALELLHRLQGYLASIVGLPHATLQPAAGAQGELLGLLLMRAYHRSQGRQRRTVVIPDSAHGTNPASVAMAGYEVVRVKTNPRGDVDLEDLESKVSEDTAGLMLTNPSTLGLFEEQIVDIAHLFHRHGALLYYDGANLNAIVGKSRPGDMGFDIVHFNTHKTFTTPHGGGGPGAGPVAVTEALEPFLPAPVVRRADDGSFVLDHDRPLSIGRMKGFHGNVGILVRAYAYIRALGQAGLRDVAETAVLNANYVLAGLRDVYDVPFDRHCKHEFVLSARTLKREHGVRALDVAKRLMDFGIHPPTIYFPLLVEEALMVEPTETESKETLDRFVAAMRRIATEAMEQPELLHEAPHVTPVGRLDEVRAAKEPVLRAR
jgi:glycine dehydrogenase subunit 2